jgi:hypothetical protein
METKNCGKHSDYESSEEDFFVLSRDAPELDADVLAGECEAVGASDDDAMFAGPSWEAKTTLSAAARERRRRRSCRLLGRYGPTWADLSPERGSACPSVHARIAAATASVAPAQPVDRNAPAEDSCTPRGTAQSEEERGTTDESGRRVYPSPEASLEQLLRRRRRPLRTEPDVCSQLGSERTSQASFGRNAARPMNVGDSSSDEDVKLVAEYPAESVEQQSRTISNENPPVSQEPMISGLCRERAMNRRGSQSSGCTGTSGNLVSSEESDGRTRDKHAEKSLVHHHHHHQQQQQQQHQVDIEAASRDTGRKTGRSRHNKSGDRRTAKSLRSNPEATRQETVHAPLNRPIPIRIMMQGMEEPMYFTVFPYTILDEIFATFARMHGFDWHNDPLHFYREADATLILSGTRTIDLALQAGETIRAVLRSGELSAPIQRNASTAVNALASSTRRTTTSAGTVTWLRIRYSSTEAPRCYAFAMHGPEAAPLGVLFSRFCKDVGISEKQTRFLDPDGEPLDPQSTAAEAGLEPDDLIEARVHNVP